MENNTNNGTIPSVDDRLTDDSALPKETSPSKGKKSKGREYVNGVNSMETLMQSINAHTKAMERLGRVTVRGSVALPDGERISAKLHKSTDIDNVETFYGAVEDAFLNGRATVSKVLERDIDGKVIARGSFRISE